MIIIRKATSKDVATLEDTVQAPRSTSIYFLNRFSKPKTLSLSSPPLLPLPPFKIPEFLEVIYYIG